MIKNCLADLLSIGEKVIQLQCLNKFLIRLNRNWTHLSRNTETDLVNCHQTTEILWILLKHLNGHQSLINKETSPKGFALK